MFNQEFLKQADSDSLFEHLISLAKTYTPEWRADASRPDFGVVLAQLFSRMLAGNMTRINRMPEKISAQLVDILDIHAVSAQPARSVVQFSPVGTDSLFVPRGTKLSATSVDGEALIYETMYGLTVTAATIGRMIFLEGKQGKIHNAAESNAITLYGKEDGLLPDAAFTLTHPYLFRFQETGKLHIAFDGISSENLEALADPERFCWSLIGETTACETAVALCEEKVLSLSCSDSGTRRQGECFSVQCKAVRPVHGEIGCTGIYNGASAANIAPEQIWQGDFLQEEGRIYPFGRSLSITEDLRLSCDSVFTQKGAEITMRFHLAYEEHRAGLPDVQPPKYKLFMKAQEPLPAPRAVFAQEALLECWNGTGWKPIRTHPRVTRIFSGETAGDISLRFTCPEDIAPLVIGASERNWIRLRLLRADGCYLANVVHHAPILSDIRFSYQCEPKSHRPESVQLLREMQSHNAAKQLNANKYVKLFSPSSLDGDRLMIGFIKKPAGDVINVYFDIEGARNPLWLEAEYSGESGLRKLHPDDYTDGFSHSGAIVFEAPRDFSSTVFYGDERYWLILRLRSQDERPAELKIRGAYLNAVDVEGKWTAETESFDVAELLLENQLRLSAKDLLDAEVWIDEAIGIGGLEKARLRETWPERIREEQAFDGAVLHFWVQWRQVRDFNACTAKDRCYKLDRSAGIVRFSDGVHGRRPNTEDCGSIQIVPILTSGARGNVPAHTITQTHTQLDFISGVDNITAACGGCDAPTADALLQYACAYIRSGGHIVTEDDLLDTVQYSCGEIAKCKLVRHHSDIVLLVLPYDFQNAHQFFLQTEENIKRVLSAAGQSLPQNFRIMLPDCVEIIIEASVVSSGDALNEEEAVRRRLDEFLHPITGGFGHSGWEIGVLPQREHIISVILSTCPKIRVDLLRSFLYNPSNSQYTDLRNPPIDQNMTVIRGKYDLRWQRKAENFHA